MPEVVPSVVGVPGLLGNARVFEPFDALLASRPGLFLDLPILDFPEMVGWLQRKVDGFDRPPHILTGSFGGLLALSLREGSAASLSLVATLPAPGLIPAGIRKRTRWVRWLPAPLVERAYRRHLAETLKKERLPTPLVHDLASLGLSKPALLSRLDSVLNWAPPFPPPAPIHWIRGATDIQAPWSDEEVQEGLNPALISTVPGSHRPYASDPAPLLEHLEAWWASTEERS